MKETVVMNKTFVSFDEVATSIASVEVDAETTISLPPLANDPISHNLSVIITNKTRYSAKIWKQFFKYYFQFRRGTSSSNSQRI